MTLVPSNINKQEWTRETRTLNQFFGKEHIYRYIEGKGAQKHRDAGLRLFTSGHLQKLEFLKIESSETVVRADVLASMTTRTIYKVSAWLLRSDGEIVSGTCACVAGKGSACKHLCCVFYGLMYIAQHDLATVPTLLACTETERQWYKPRDPRNVPHSFEDLVFSKDTWERLSSAPEHHNKRMKYSSLKPEREVMTTRTLIGLHGKLKENGLQCFADILEANDFLCDKSTESTKDNNVRESMPLRWLDAVKKSQTLVYSADDVAAVESATRLQSGSTLWHHYRKGFIMASVAHRVYTWVKTCETKMGPHDARSLLSAIMGKKCRATYAMKRGLSCEDNARKEFIEQNKGHLDIQVEQCGLLLCRSNSFLGASPDGIVKCLCCEPSVLEIKSPMNLDTFCKSELRDGYLKRSSRYFTQVQMQMGVSCLQSCILFVYSEQKCVQVSVNFDQSFFDELVKRCKFFCEKYLVPSFLGS
ncbi:uncharacterized protein LOC125946376 [Dermacentor silvarum]|uniref:uncharacterized protein LOC125946376 n=1 Tax=Dermacentor silvarum TaxID=543639 RepID=UPI002101A28C|nr:uncharacterized protein LOC125946376 [Dermacentor silvarum]